MKTIKRTKKESNLICLFSSNLGLPRWCNGKESVCQFRRLRRWGFNPWVGKIPWRKKRQPIPVFLLGKFHGERSLVGSPCVHGVTNSWTQLSDRACTNCLIRILFKLNKHDGVITHQEPDILECEVKWALESIITNKAGGGDGIPVKLFQSLKDDAVKVLHSICQQIWKTQQWPQDWKRSVFIPILKKGNPKECSNYRTIALISHASKVMPKILQARLQQYLNRELPDVQAGFRKGRGTRDQIANVHWIIEKAREFQKNI